MAYALDLNVSRFWLLTAEDPRIREFELTSKSSWRES
jgi:hypothetical protein